MSDYPMLISNKLHSFRNFVTQIYGNSMKWQISHTNTCEDIFLYVFFINPFQCLRHLGYGNQAGIERGMIIP